jgi:cyclic pyranopterin phosphate synthase
LIEKAVSVGVKPRLTTNAILLGRQIDSLYDAGLRVITIGYYGFAEEYDAYVASHGAYEKLERSISEVRDRYGMGVVLQINYLLMKPSCSVPQLRRAWSLALKYRLFLQVDLIHYSLPYFSEGPNRCLQFTPEDAPRLRSVTEELLRIKACAPDLYSETMASIRSLPDWALKGPNMAVPCDAYKLLWVGADGSVRLCYAAFPLGNLHQTRLRDIFGAQLHRDACQQAFRLDCPRCHCERGSRVEAHLPTRLQYSDTKLHIFG